MIPLKSRLKRFKTGRGGITVSLSIVMVCVLTVVNIISESARVNIIQTESKTFTFMAGESLLAGYARQVFKDYGILLVWEDLPIEDKARKYIQANINLADIEIPGTNFMKTELTEVCSNEKKYVTDEGGNFLIHQILSYMKYAGVENAVKLLLSHTEETNNNKLKNNEDMGKVTDAFDEKNEKILKVVSEISKKTEKLHNVKELEERLTNAKKFLERFQDNIFLTENNKKRKKLLEMFQALKAAFSEKKELSEKLISLSTSYETIKKEILTQWKISKKERDYVEKNLTILRNIKDKIDKNEQFFDSQMSNSTSILTLINSMKEIIHELKNLILPEVTKQDQKNKLLYEQAKSFIQGGALSLITDDVSRVSKNAFSDTQLPSDTKTNKKETETLLDEVKNKALMTLYIRQMFGNYTKEKKDTVLKYEYEYILCGHNNDRDNLMGVVEKLLFMRNMVNVAYLLTDGEKMSQISTLSTSVAAALAMPFLEPVIKGIFVEAWALKESLMDVKALLNDKKVAMIKTKATWHSDFGTINLDSGGDKKGLSYENYCQILMMSSQETDMTYRIMDLIQLNIKKRYNATFCMSKCLTQIDITAKYRTHSLFSAIPMCVALLSSEKRSYEYDISYKNQF